ncbi:hypothetical protein BSFA1_75870 (plasmid) [Burkholderia sp. SFA1]|nr:hypothetical protein BSFA1_75870 [Burkholderia sp. SFA1]
MAVFRRRAFISTLGPAHEISFLVFRDSLARADLGDCKHAASVNRRATNEEETHSYRKYLVIGVL